MKLAPEAIAQVERLVREGDKDALRMVLQYAVPRPSNTTFLKLTGLTGTLPQQAERIVQEMADGAVGVSEAGTVIGALANLSRLRLDTEVEERVKALEPLLVVRHSDSDHFRRP